jgi:acetylornithine deacetylase/succinyl-diaminopimelate desuccinylase-like protein
VDRDPFDPAIETRRKGKVIRGRGASDDKGQLMTFVEACRAWKAVHGALPARLTFFFEGEEESGSPSLVPFWKAMRDELTADLALICDTGLFDSRVPAITTMLRGLLGEEIVIRPPTRTCIRACMAGWRCNPIRVLARILAAAARRHGPDHGAGFLRRRARALGRAARAMGGLGFDAGAFLGGVGLSEPAGEQGRSRSR